MQRNEETREEKIARELAMSNATKFVKPEKIKLGGFSATITQSWYGNPDFTITATFYDRSDTSIVQRCYYEQTELSVIIVDAVRRELRLLNAARVASDIYVDGYTTVVGFTYTGDLHCVDCTRDLFGQAAIDTIINTGVYPDNVADLLASGYPADSEGNAVRDYFKHEAQEQIRMGERVSCCGDCTAPLIDVNDLGIDPDYDYVLD